MALAVPCNRNDWSNPLWDQREQSRETRRVSETSESSEEGWPQSNHAGPSDESEEGSVDQDGLEDSYNEEDEEEEEEEEEEDDYSDDEGPHKNTRRYATAGRARRVSADEVTRVDAMTKCEEDEEYATSDEEDEEVSDTEEEESDETEEDGEDDFDYWGEDEDFQDDEDDSDDEEDCKTLYHHDTYPTEVFQSLENFRHSNLLIDLFLSTQDGHTLRAHSPVMGALSSVVLQKLRAQWEWSHSDIHLSLDPGVTRRGAAAVLEFAYTGCIPTLCKDTIYDIQRAARALGVPRVLELCKLQEEEEQKSKEKEDNKVKPTEEEDNKVEQAEEEDNEVNQTEEEEEEEAGRLSPEEELKITLKSMRDLWAEKSGCDIMLQADCRIFPGK